MNSYLLEIMTPERLFFDGQVESLQINGSDGELSIWKGHATMLATMPVGGLTIHTAEGEVKDAFHSEGFVEVRPDRVLVFVQSCEWPEEINAARAREAMDRANEKLRQKQSILEHRHTEISLARAMARLRIKRGH